MSLAYEEAAVITNLLAANGANISMITANIDGVFHSLGEAGGTGGIGSTDVKVTFNGAEVPVFRGGNSFTVNPDEIKIDPDTGLLKTSHGVSLDVDPSTVSKFGGAYRIDFLPDGLQIIQRGVRLEHFEIVPKSAMTLEQFQNLLSQIISSPVN